MREPRVLTDENWSVRSSGRGHEKDITTKKTLVASVTMLMDHEYLTTIDIRAQSLKYPTKSLKLGPSTMNTAGIFRKRWRRNHVRHFNSAYPKTLPSLHGGIYHSA